MSVYSKIMFWTNKKLSLMVAWSSSVSISCFKAQSSIGHLLWFFDSGNSIVSGANLWCPYRLLGGMQPSNDILENINSDSFAQNWSILVLIGKLPFSVVKSLLQRVKYLETQQEVQFERVSFCRFDPFLVAILSLFHHQFCSI